MRAFRIENTGIIREGDEPLTERVVAPPVPRDGELLIRISCCGVCHTELDEIEGRTPPPVLPVIPGHQVVGEVVGLGSGVSDYSQGDRVGVGWIHSCCNSCKFCLSGRENLCESFVATGRDRNGGYAEYMTIPAQSAFTIPAGYADHEAAPLLCAGAIGYRSLRLAGIDNGEPLGLTGFGASAHLVLQLARHLYPDSDLFVFARSMQQRQQALRLGAAWSGASDDTPPEPPRAIIDTTPAWTPVINALTVLQRGGRLVINAIRKEPGDFQAIQGLDYARHLWLEKEVKSVANIARCDLQEFLPLAAEADIRPEVTCYGFGEANRALADLKFGGGTGARVLVA